MNSEIHCRACAILEGVELVLDYFEGRFLEAHPELRTLATLNGEFDQDVIFEAAEQMADIGDQIALDFMVAFGLWGTIEEELAQDTGEEPLDK